MKDLLDTIDLYDDDTPGMADGGRIELKEGTTKKFYDESTGHIYPRKNRFGTFYSDTPAGGLRRNIIPDDIGKKILKEYEDGAGTIKLGEKYGFGKDTINRYIKKFNPKLLRDSPPKANQYDFDYSVIDKIREDAKNMSRKQILKKYENKISDTKLDRLVKAGKVKFGVVEESGRPRVPPGQIPEGTVKRTNRIRNVQGFAISGTQAKNFHHIFPIGGLADFSPQDVMILDKDINEKLGGFNLRLNDIADEIGSMDLSSPDALKKLNDLNAESKQIVDKAKAGLPKKLKNIIGYIEYSPVFDSNGTIVELSQVRKGLDKNPSALAKFGSKKFKDFSDADKKLFKKQVLSLAKKAEDKGMMLAAKIPGVTDLFNMAKSIPDDIKRAKYLKAGFKTLGIAAAPLVIYDTYKAFEQGKPILEALEQGFIGTDLIGGTKRILSLTPEERLARSVVKQDALKDLNVDMPMGFGFIEGPTPDTDLTLQQAKQKMDKGIQRVKELEAEKNLQRSVSRGFGTPANADEFLAGGGIAGLSGGIDKGPQRISMNPDSQGLRSLGNRARNR